MKGVWLSVVVALQVAWMAGTAISKERNLRGETTVLLETVPVDPRDFLRGDFVILNYKISELPAVNGVRDRTDHGRDVYVTLEKRGRFYEAMEASLEAPESKPGKIVARGSLDVTNNRWRVIYGIEQYYVAEGTGNPRGMVTVECVVTKEGTLQIKEVFVDGKPYAAAMRELK